MKWVSTSFHWLLYHPDLSERYLCATLLSHHIKQKWKRSAMTFGTIKKERLQHPASASCDLHFWVKTWGTFLDRIFTWQFVFSRFIFRPKPATVPLHYSPVIGGKPSSTFAQSSNDSRQRLLPFGSPASLATTPIFCSKEHKVHFACGM